jgi:hypothetical protein
MRPLDTVAGYALVRPAMSDALVAVHRAYGPNAGTVWAQLLTAAGLDGDESDDTALHRMLEAMTSSDPVLGIIARSLRIRLDVYTLLASRTAPSPAAQFTAGSNA